MKRVVVTSIIGAAHTKLAEVTLPTIRAWASSMGADVKVLEAVLPEHAGQTGHWAKFAIHGLLDVYEEALWLDADIVASPRAPDIFEATGGALAAYPEGDVVERAGQFKEYYRLLRGHALTFGKQIRYFNSGVMVIPREARDIYKVPALEEIELTTKLKREHPDRFFFDQNLLNARIMETTHRIVPLSNRWNFMQVPSEAAGDHWEKRTEIAHLIHYAGLLACMEPDQVLDLARADLRKWGG